MCPPSSVSELSSSSFVASLEPESFVPPTEVSKAAYNLATSLLHPAIMNHSIRVYLYARAMATASNSVYLSDPAKQDLLFTACILHDIGTADTYDGPQRFEVEGGDAAVALLSKFGVSEEGKKDVWIAIALHTSPGIVERMGELSALLRHAVKVDFGREYAPGIEDLADLKARFERRFERKDIEKVLGDAVVEQAIRNPAKAPPASWVGVLYKSHLENPDWKGVNKAF